MTGLQWRNKCYSNKPEPEYVANNIKECFEMRYCVCIVLAFFIHSLPGSALPQYTPNNSQTHYYLPSSLDILLMYTFYDKTGTQHNSKNNNNDNK